MMRPQVPWYGAALASLVATFVVVAGMRWLFEDALGTWAAGVEFSQGEGAADAILTVIWVIPIWLTAIVVWSLLRHSEHGPQEYLHCLKCGYILQGLSEPRCPECGERI